MSHSNPFVKINEPVSILYSYLKPALHSDFLSFSLLPLSIPSPCTQDTFLRWLALSGLLWAVTPRRLASFWWPRRLEEEMLAGVESAVPLLGAAWCLPRGWTGLVSGTSEVRQRSCSYIIRPFPLRLRSVRSRSITLGLGTPFLNCRFGRQHVLFYPGAEWRGFSYHRDCKSGVNKHLWWWL